MTADRLTHLEGVVEGLAADLAELQQAVARLQRPPDDGAEPMTLDDAIRYLERSSRALRGKAGNGVRCRQLARVIATLEALRRGETL